MRIIGSLAKNFLVKGWEMRLSVHDAIAKSPLPERMSMSILTSISRQRFKDNGQWKCEGFSKTNMDAYFCEIFRLPSSGDYVLPVCVEPGPWSRKPLEMRIPNFAASGGTPVSFIYGDVDWMDRDGTNRLLQKLPHIKYLTSKNSGHTLYMDNPAEFARCVREAVVAGRADVVAESGRRPSGAAS